VSTERTYSHEDTDDQLMRATSGGDPGAFREIVRRYERTAWKIAFRFLGDSMDAEDAAQETFIKVLDSARRYLPKGNFRTYFYSILTRTCVDHYRKRRPEGIPELPEMPDLSASPAENLMAKERDELVRKALDALPANQKAAIILRHYEGLSYHEISEILNISVKAVEGLIGRARVTLQIKLSTLKIN
jgi:RNA polymerase sigma-70 factor (ECF subfamily)